MIVSLWLYRGTRPNCTFPDNSALSQQNWEKAFQQFDFCCTFRCLGYHHLGEFIFEEGARQDSSFGVRFWCEVRLDTSLAAVSPTAMLT